MLLITSIEENNPDNSPTKSPSRNKGIISFRASEENLKANKNLSKLVQFPQ